MAGNPAWRFLPKESTSESKHSLFDQANAVGGSALRILNDELGCAIPEDSQSKSWKFHCPWGVEHADGGLDKAARFYWATDHGYCFMGHGVLDVVTLRSLQWRVEPWAAAKRIIEQAEKEAVRKPWRERLITARDRVLSDAPKPMDVGAAREALGVALRGVPGYVERQYREDVREVVVAALAALDPSWDFSDVQVWIKVTSREVARRIGSG